MMTKIEDYVKTTSVSSLPFHPFQGTENRINTCDVVPGNLYFTTDSGKILLDTLNGRMALGNNGSAIFFSKIEGLTELADGTYIIFQKDLNDQIAIPKQDDLIINISVSQKGQFFRVESFTEASAGGYATCTLIGVSGIGGGGGSSSDPSISDPKRIEYEQVLPTTTKFVYGAPITVGFTITKSPVKTLTAELVVSKMVNLTNVVIKREFQNINLNDDNYVEFTKLEDVIEPNGIYSIEVTISGIGATSNGFKYTGIECIELVVKKGAFNATQKYSGESLVFPVIITGGNNKNLIVKIDDEILYNQPQNNIDVETSVPVGLSLEGLDAGIHTISAYLMSQGIQSEVVQTDFLYHPSDAEDNTYIILIDYPNRCLSYETPVVKYWVCDTAKTSSDSNIIQESINGVGQTREIVQSNQPIEWNVTNLIPNQKNECSISCEGSENTQTFFIYCEKSDIFDEASPSTLALSLKSDGRTNDTNLDKRLQWNYKNIFAKLLGFNWENNGWIKDEDSDRVCLRINNGAEVQIPLELFTESSLGYTLEFEFKPYNLQSYKLLTQSVTTTSNEEDEDKTEVIVNVNRAFDPSLAVISYAKITTQQEGTETYDVASGFCCGTQDAFFRMADGDHAYINYMENEIITIAVTIDKNTSEICMYVNGILSGMSSFVNKQSNFPSANNIIINSNLCDIDLYSIRVYNTALSSADIVKNYISNTKDLDLYMMNQFSTGSTVDFAALQTYNENHPNNTTIPYIIFETTSKPDVLPFNKNNPSIDCDITFVNPALDVAFTNDLVNEEDYLSHAPSFKATGVSLNVQGTSSQIYPRKNFKGKFKNAIIKTTHSKFKEQKTLSYFKILPHMEEKTFTWKADYMDSSSGHNTGFATWAQELYWNHPLDYYEGSSKNPGANKFKGDYLTQGYRTTLYGFPVLAFHKTSDNNSKPQFIGIYNFNLDKGADTTLGMNLDKSHPILTDKTYEKVCECWEFANNKGTRCSFRGEPFDSTYDSTNKVFTTPKGIIDLGDDLEVRYHIDADLIEGALKNLSGPEDDEDSKSIEPEKAFNILLGHNEDEPGRYLHLETLFKWIQDSFFAFDLAKDQVWLQKLLKRNTTVTADDEDYKDLIQERQNKFKDEFNEHLNLEYCMIYYILTEVCLMFDSRGKNMMLASWGPMRAGGEYIWFPIFYDADTQLGVNNSGIPSWTYNIEPSTGFNNNNTPAFSTPNSLLWLNFHKYYTEVDLSTLKNYYGWLRTQLALDPGYINARYALTSNDEEKEYFRTGILPINIFNANEYYKYILPGIEGFVKDIDKETKLPEMSKPTKTYYYCVQGTRELNRRQFLRNRFNYYDSKWNAKEYTVGDTNSQEFWRFSPILYTQTGNGNPETALQPDLKLHLIAKLDQYSSVWADDSASGQIIQHFTPAGNKVEFDLSPLIDVNSVNDQIVRIGKESNFFEIGNLSLLYPQLLNYDKATDIKKIELGNKNSKYKNYGAQVQGLGNEITGGHPLLQVLDITNVQYFGTSCDFSDPAITEKAYKLEEFKALGSSVTDVTFANSSNLRKVYLPSRIQKINLPNLINLTRLLQKQDVYNGEGDSIEWITPEPDGLYLDSYQNLNEIIISGGGLKQHSYNLLQNVINASLNSNRTTPLEQISLTGVQWTPYTQLGEGARYDKDSTYYKANDNATFTSYEYNSTTWDNDILSGRIYRYDESDTSFAKNLTLLDTLMNNNLFNSNLTLSGEFYIDNESAISEKLLSTTYKRAFPNLDIKVKTIEEDTYRVCFVKYFNNIETTLSLQKIDKAGLPGNLSNITVPTNANPPENYIFLGWSNQRPTGDIKEDSKTIINDIQSEILKLENDSDNQHTFYAIYDKRPYTITYKDDGDREYIGDAFSVSMIAKHGETVPTYDQVYKQANDTDIVDVPLRVNQEKNLANLTDRLSFVGWTLDQTKSGVAQDITVVNKSLVTPESLSVDRDYIFYPVYTIESVYESITPEKYFYFDTCENNGRSGYSISVRPNYKLKGKITIPSTYNGLSIFEIKNFQNAIYASHIFFENEKDHPISTVCANAFTCADNVIPTLEGIYFSDNLTKIETGAFQYLYSLKYISYHVLKSNDIATISPNITSIGSNAFDGGASATHPNAMSLILSELPAKLNDIGQSAFWRCKNIAVQQLPNSLKTIDTNAFAFCNSIKIYKIPQSVETIGASAFTSFLPSDTESIAHKDIGDIYIYGLPNIGTGAFHCYGQMDPKSNQLAPISLVTLHFDSQYESVIDEKYDESSIGVKSIVSGLPEEVI